MYSHSDVERTSALLHRFEDLNDFFERNRIVTAWYGAKQQGPLRVIAFSGKQEYEQFKIRATADAYYVSNMGKSYIVVPTPHERSFGLAAHEYAHFVLHSAGVHLPVWMGEGIAEVFSTLTLSPGGWRLGGSIAAHADTLHRRTWLPLSELAAETETSTRLRETRERASLFYAESWALMYTLIADPHYASHFGDLMRALQSDAVPFDSAFASVYHQSAEVFFASAREWLSKGAAQKEALVGRRTPASSVAAAVVSPDDISFVLADLLFADGQLDRAEQSYLALLNRSPQNADTLAALGGIALQRHHRTEALVYWKRALDAHIADAGLCYRYATVLDQDGSSPSEMKRALETTIQLDPKHDEARWRLALLLNNEAEFEQALVQLKAMRPPQADRAFGYWAATAYALSELGRTADAEAASANAAKYAQTAEERARAAEIGYMARTDMAVQVTRDADGELKLSTTRVPKGSTDFNPFIEPQDTIKIVTGNLQEVQCNAGRLTGLVVQSHAGSLRLLVPDPFHILVRNGPSQFNCGTQPARNVTVEYAATDKTDEGILRGMKF